MHDSKAGPLLFSLPQGYQILVGKGEAARTECRRCGWRARSSKASAPDFIGELAAAQREHEAECYQGDVRKAIDTEELPH